MEIPRHWRLRKQRYSLQGNIDSAGNVNFPPTPVGKFNNTDQSRAVAVSNAAKIAEKNLATYTGEMIRAQIEQGVEV